MTLLLLYLILHRRESKRKNSKVLLISAQSVDTSSFKNSGIYTIQGKVCQKFGQHPMNRKGQDCVLTYI